MGANDAGDARARRPRRMDAGAPWRDVIASGARDSRLVADTYEGPGRARWAKPPQELHPDVLDALGQMGMARLYSHQREAVYSAWEAPTIVTTGTASGKSMCFNLPTLDVLCRDRKARALYLYPTKALAQDQARALARFGLTKRVRPALYVGDTPRQARAEIRRGANVVLTNPDMLHVGILPNHESWGDFMANLAVVVVDEAHVYRGVFGSHVANVLRRLRRVADAYGTAPRFLLASATIANPVELAERLTGLEDVRLIDSDGAPAPKREIAVWNPPLIDEHSGARRPVLSEASELVSGLVRCGARVICFMSSRKRVELMCQAVRANLAQTDSELAAGVAPYRAGYTPAQRQELEERLLRGELRAVVTTNALELGIDIGELDAAVVVTFPGTVASLRQMWGRAGRRGHGLAVYMAGEDALDQFFCRHPEDFLGRPVEAAILDYSSPQIRAAHLLCAAHERPLGRGDDELLGDGWRQAADALVSAGELRKRKPEDSYVPRRPGDYPARRFSLRSASAHNVSVIDVSSGELLGTVEGMRAQSTVHAGAIYLHLGRSYEVHDLDLERGRALVESFEGDWYTQPKRETETTIERIVDGRQTLGVNVCFGQIEVTETVIAYQRRSLADHSPVGLVALDLPQTSFSTQALWYELDGILATDVGAEEMPLEALLGSLHAAEHAQIAVLPLLAMCDRWDIGGLSTNLHPQTGGPAIFIYDGYPGGVGISRAAFARFEELCKDAARLIGECKCTGGCPSCVQSPKCGNLNEPLSKAGARVLLEAMLASERPAGAQGSRGGRSARTYR
jgi:DEAD/DEAH box helicase domain-containing protein